MTNPKLVSGLGVLFCGDGLQLLLQRKLALGHLWARELFLPSPTWYH